MRFSTRILISLLTLLFPVGAAAQWYSCGTGKCRTDLVEPGESVPTQCTGAPCTETTSDLNTAVKYTRVTDSGTVGPNPSDFFTTNGSAEQMEWNSNSTMFYVNNPVHGVNHFFTLNTGTGVPTKVTCTFSGNNCWNGLLTTIKGTVSSELTSDGPMSGLSPYVYYGIAGSTIQKMDFSAVISSGGSTADTDTMVVDAAACSGIPTTANSNELAMDDNDTRFAAAFGGSGQDTWTLIYVYDTAQGCRWLDLSAFTLGGQWGTTGTASYFDEAGGSLTNAPCSQIHNVRLSRDGRWASITTNCTNMYEIFWDISTGNIYRDNYNNVAPYYGGGHKFVGWNNLFVNVDTDYANLKWFAKRTLPPLGLPTWLTSGRSGFDDSHISWNNQTSGHLQPYFVAAYQTGAPSAAFGDEIFAVSTDGSGTVYRFAYAYSRAHDFNAQIMANVSRDGCWVIYTTDHTTSRDDVYLVGPLPATGGCGTGGHGGGGGGGEPPPPSALLWVVQ